MLGEDGDIAFVYAPTRAAVVLKEILGTGWKGTLQTDGYEVYASYSASQPQCTHALCWAHTRRALLKAEASQPEITRQGLEMIRALYRFEEQLRGEGADAARILHVRQSESATIVDKFFE